jgi:hypothetical protein
MTELIDSPLTQTAAAARDFVVDTSGWIHRRVDSVAYRERLIVRRSISVDFTIPEAFPQFAPLGSGEALYYMPIALLRKWPPLPRFDLRTEGSRPIPLLTSTRNRHVDACVLLAVPPDGALKDRLRDEIARVPLSSARRSRQALDRLGPEVVRNADYFSAGERRAWLDTLLLAADLVRNTILWVRVRAFPEQRLVIKLAFDEPVGLRENFGRAIVRSLGWVPYRYNLAIPHLGDGGSFHAQFEPPPGIEIQTISFWVRHAWDPEPSDLGRFGRRTGEALVRGVRGKLSAIFPRMQAADLSHGEDAPIGEPSYWNARQLGHLYLSGGRRKHLGYAKFDCAVENRAFPTSALLAALAIAILLTVAACNASTIDGVHQFAPSVTVFLLVPGLLGYVVARSAEHPLVTAHLIGVRRLAVVAGALPLIAAVRMLLAGPDNSSAVQCWWTALTAVAWVIVGLLFLSWLLPGPEFRISRTTAPPPISGRPAD